MKQQKALTLKTLTKSNVWEVEENDIFRMWETAEKESDFRDNRNHYIDVIRSAFEIEEIKIDKPEVIKKYEARDFKVGNIHFDDNENKTDIPVNIIRYFFLIFIPISKNIIENPRNIKSIIIFVCLP